MDPKNFDTDPETNRGYRLGQEFVFVFAGETFELRHGLAIGSNALDAWWPVLRRMNASEEDQAAWPEMFDSEGRPGTGGVWTKVDDEEFLRVFRESMHNILRPGQEDKLDRILDPALDEPLMIRDCVEVILWAVPVVAGARPTEASSASSNGSTAPNPEPAATSSTDDFTSPEDAASPPSLSGSSAT